MALDHKANEDFKRAVSKALWRRVSSWLKPEKNDLIPFHEIRRRLPIKGQSYLGLQTVPLDSIIGSTGRYRDFDRAFLPRQTRTRQRWLNIDMAHLADIQLPPVELYKIGEAYFVKDGNHRVSVAREQGQLEIEAEVVEITVPVNITAAILRTDLDLKEEYAKFNDVTRLDVTRRETSIELTRAEDYARLLEHINVHRWFLGEERDEYVRLEEAAISWHDQVFLPLVQAIRDEQLLKEFAGNTEADLFLWVIEYQWNRREAYRDRAAPEDAADVFVHAHEQWPGKKLVRVLRDASWLDHRLIAEERLMFRERTKLHALRPEADVSPSLPGQYERLLEHIDVHRWYLGEQRGDEVPYAEAVTSWYDNVYHPLISVIRAQQVLDYFPRRSEADLYIWILEHRDAWLGETRAAS